MSRYRGYVVINVRPGPLGEVNEHDVMLDWPRVAGLPVRVQLGRARSVTSRAAEIIAGHTWTAREVEVVGHEPRAVRAVVEAGRDYERRAAETW